MSLQMIHIKPGPDSHRAPKLKESSSSTHVFTDFPLIQDQDAKGSIYSPADLELTIKHEDLDDLESIIFEISDDSDSSLDVDESHFNFKTEAGCEEDSQVIIIEDSDVEIIEEEDTMVKQEPGLSRNFVKKNIKIEKSDIKKEAGKCSRVFKSLTSENFFQVFMRLCVLFSFKNTYQKNFH